MPRKKPDDGARMGKVSGYKIVGPDTYEIAPMYGGEFRRIEAERVAVDQLLDAVSEHAQRQYKALTEQRMKLFDKILDDLSLSKDERIGSWTYHHFNRTLKFIPQPQPEPDN